MANGHRASFADDLVHVRRKLRQGIRLEVSLEVDGGHKVLEDRLAGAQPRAHEGPRAEEMLSRVEPHVLVTSFPVDRALDLGTDHEFAPSAGGGSDPMNHRGSAPGHVDDLRSGLPEGQGAPVRRLAPSRGVEEGPVENNASRWESDDSGAERPNVG